MYGCAARSCAWPAPCSRRPGNCNPPATAPLPVTPPREEPPPPEHSATDPPPGPRSPSEHGPPTPWYRPTPGHGFARPGPRPRNGQSFCASPREPGTMTGHRGRSRGRRGVCGSAGRLVRYGVSGKRAGTASPARALLDEARLTTGRHLTRAPSGDATPARRPFRTHAHENHSRPIRPSKAGQSDQSHSPPRGRPPLTRTWGDQRTLKRCRSPRTPPHSDHRTVGPPPDQPGDRVWG